MTSAQSNEVVLLSVRSPHVERLLDGTKTVEFRRRSWNVPDGTLVVLYAARDRRAIVGSVVVESTEVGTPQKLWRTHGSRSGLSSAEFNLYFDGASIAVAITVGTPRVLRSPLTLEELRRRTPQFHVPQSYRYMAALELAGALNGEHRELLGRHR